MAPPVNGGPAGRPTPLPRVATLSVPRPSANSGARPQIPPTERENTRIRGRQPTPPNNGGRGDAPSLNPRPPRRRRQNGASGSRCCDCNRLSHCTAAAQSTCPCALARPPRACTNCCPGSNRCRNNFTPPTVCAPQRSILEQLAAGRALAARNWGGHSSCHSAAGNRSNCCCPPPRRSNRGRGGQRRRRR